LNATKTTSNDRESMATETCEASGYTKANRRTTPRWPMVFAIQPNQLPSLLNVPRATFRGSQVPHPRALERGLPNDGVV